jgi:hypothetical protein
MHFFQHVVKIADVGSGLHIEIKVHMDPLPKSINSLSRTRDGKNRVAIPVGGRYCGYAMALSLIGNPRYLLPAPAGATRIVGTC